MATKTISTRIKNRYDSLTNWKKDGVTLLPGEIALVSVTTQEKQTVIDENGDTTVKVVEVPAVLMKVGEAKEYNTDGTPKSYKTFDELPWLSAKAADVYAWAKTEDPSSITVKYNKGTDATADWRTSTLAEILEDLDSIVADLSAVKSNKLDDITVISEGTTGVVKTVAKGNNKGEIVVTKDVIGETDIDDSAVTNTKIAKDAVTSDKIVSVQAAKIEIEPKSGDKEAVMLPEKLSAIAGELADIKDAITDGTHFIGITTTELVDDSATSTITVDNKSHTPNKGDIVIYGEKEFIWTGSKWEELGDLTRVGALETLLSALPASKKDHEFVTHIANENNKLVAKTARPTAVDVSYDASSNVSEKIAEIEAELAKKMETHGHPYARDDHGHGNISNVGTITSTAVKAATGLLVYDSANKIQRAAAEDVRSIIGAGTSSLTLAGSGSATTAAKSDHTHETYDGQLSAINGNYVRYNSTDAKLYVGKDGNDSIIFDCGGAL